MFAIGGNRFASEDRGAARPGNDFVRLTFGSRRVRKAVVYSRCFTGFSLPWRICVTVDEELSLLEESVRRLKIEYDVFFGGGAKKPPADTEWRVSNLVKEYSDGHRQSL